MPYHKFHLYAFNNYRASDEALIKSDVNEGCSSEVGTPAGPKTFALKTKWRTLVRVTDREVLKLLWSLSSAFLGLGAFAAWLFGQLCLLQLLLPSCFMGLLVAS